MLASVPAAPALVPGWRCVPGDRRLSERAGRGGGAARTPARRAADYRSQGASAISLPPSAGPASLALVVLAGSAPEEFQRKSGQKLEATDRGKGRRKGQEKEGPSLGCTSPNPPRAPGWGRSAGDGTEGVPPRSRAAQRLVPAPIPALVRGWSSDPPSRRRPATSPTPGDAPRLSAGPRAP